MQGVFLLMEGVCAGSSRLPRKSTSEGMKDPKDLAAGTHCYMLLAEWGYWEAGRLDLLQSSCVYECKVIES